MDVKVSVIVPCYNQAQYLEECLQSVLRQSYRNWECIIVNDGSTDKTETIAKQCCEQDPRFKYLYKKNGGLSSARNYGIEEAKGSYIQFLDADDVLYNEKLLLSVRKSKELVDKDHIIVSNFRQFTKDVSNSTKPFCNLRNECFTFTELLYSWDVKFTIPIHCGFFSISLFDYFRFPESLKAKEDWIMWLTFLKNNAVISFVDLPLVLYRFHPNSMTRQFEHMEENYFKTIVYLKQIIPYDIYCDFLIVVLKRKQEKIVNLNEVINIYTKSKGFKFLLKLKRNIFTKFLIKLLKYLIQKLNMKKS